MLETIQEFGFEMLVATDETAAAWSRHAAWCIEFAERAEPMLTGPEQGEWFARLRTEHANLRAALAWVVGQGIPKPRCVSEGTLPVLGNGRPLQ